jgi:hypothetical protein
MVDAVTGKVLDKSGWGAVGDQQTWTAIEAPPSTHFAIVRLPR